MSGHLGAGLSAVAYSARHRVLATGDTGGRLAVWDPYAPPASPLSPRDGAYHAYRVGHKVYVFLARARFRSNPTMFLLQSTTTANTAC